jgi:hypothetical protein
MIQVLGLVLIELLQPFSNVTVSKRIDILLNFIAKLYFPNFSLHSKCTIKYFYMIIKTKMIFIIATVFLISISSCSDLDIALKPEAAQTKTAEIEFQKFELVDYPEIYKPRYNNEKGVKGKTSLYILGVFFVFYLTFVLFFSGKTHGKTEERVSRANHIKSRKVVEKLPSDSSHMDSLYNKTDSLPLPTIQVSILLKKGERGLAETIAKISETRARRVNQSVFGGKRGKKSSFYGGSIGTSKSHQELTVLDKGVICLTNKRLVFIGSKTNRDIKLDKIISLNNKDRWFSSDQIVISTTGKSKQMYFSMTDMEEFKGKIKRAINEL